MTFLDCESIDSTLVSLQSALCLDSHEIKGRLLGCDLDSLLDAKPDIRGPEQALLDLFPERDRSWPYSYVCWFHLTRCLPTDFSEGILPLPKILEKTWTFLEELARSLIPDIDWRDFRSRVERAELGHFSCLYQLKTSNSSQWGPFAVLVRDVAFVPNQVGNHDYLRTPEIVEDICLSFQEAYNVDLLRQFIQATSPYVVKFKDQTVRQDCVGTALCYAYRAVQGKPLSHCESICFDAGGKAIPSDQILDIQVIEYS